MASLCTDDEVLDALQRVGLQAWLVGLPAGLFGAGQSIVIATRQMPNSTSAIDLGPAAAGMPPNITAGV